MIPELGHYAMTLALCVALAQGIVPMVGAWLDRDDYCALAVTAARTQAGLLSVAFLCLAISFLQFDFSVLYVAQNSNLSLPWYYRLSAVWGAHEGSLLLWALILSLWGLAVSCFSASLPLAVRARVLSVLGLIGVGFLMFMLFTSNPFERLLPAPLNGRDLNPLLQDFGLIIHPPLLYMGYVGLAVPFSFAIAALLTGRVDAAWTRWTRPWTTLAWVFLTLGITLGSWWAYYELGWGGWWFWDPVENASFMPWLVATALLHSLAVTEQRGAFRAWTVLLALTGFALSLLGTFLVRSGVLVSVHAFASDPERGFFILAFLSIVIGFALLLFAMRAHTLRDSARFEPFSRETLLLVNNVVLVVASATVLLGTLFPIASEFLGIGKYSVGPPYFNVVFVALMAPLLVLLGIAPGTRWKKDNWSRRKVRLARWLLLGAVVTGLWLWLLPETKTELQPTLIAGLGLASWILVATLGTLLERVMGRGRGGPKMPSRSFAGMTLAHLGVSMLIAGVTITSMTSTETDVALRPGEQQAIDGYSFQFDGVNELQGPNYRALQGTINVDYGTQRIAVLHPQKRFYSTTAEPMTEAAIDAGLTRDLYVALGEPLGDDAWSLRLYHKPYVRWIWLGALIMALGGGVAASDRRYRVRKSAAGDLPSSVAHYPPAAAAAAGSPSVAQGASLS